MKQAGKSKAGHSRLRARTRPESITSTKREFSIGFRSKSRIRSILAEWSALPIWLNRPWRCCIPVPYAVASVPGAGIGSRPPPAGTNSCRQSIPPQSPPPASWAGVERERRRGRRCGRGGTDGQGLSKENRGENSFCSHQKDLRACKNIPGSLILFIRFQRKSKLLGA